MKIFIFFLLILLVFNSCKNQSNKKHVPLSNDLKVAELPKPIDKEIIDSFSKATNKIFCSQKLRIGFGNYVFTFCKDTVTNLLNVVLPSNLKTNNLDTAILLCRRIPFSLTDTRTKKEIRSIHYLHKKSYGSNSKTLCLQHIRGTRNLECLVWDNWIN